MNKSDIQWLDGGYTWNPIKMRCTRASDGCKNCWHIRMAKRHVGNHTFGKDRRAAYAGKAPVLDEKELTAPLRIKNPAKIALQLMGDLFHKQVPDEWLSRIFKVMHEAHHHTFQILTKRPERMQKWMARYWNYGNNTVAIDNIWMGVSVEDQATADERIPILHSTPAAVRWISAEPLLASVDLCAYRYGRLEESEGLGIDWVVVGGESGPGARPFDINWARSIRDQCKAAGTSFFCKQIGARPMGIGAEELERECPDADWRNWPKDHSGGDMAEWPEDLRIRQFPEAA